MHTINWGIIGCGNVTELKSGPAFNKVRNSRLVAVMRRDKEKAADYAKRHNVPKYYADADELINDPEINAVYIATPPSSHERYAIQALTAGKPVYLEKPMSVSAESAKNILHVARQKDQKLCIAHYRRQQPLFLRVKEMVAEKKIGNIKSVNLRYYKQALDKTKLENPGVAWRVDPKISGGGLFHDLAPHQLDLMLYFFGEVRDYCGFASGNSDLYGAPDVVGGTIQFRSDVIFTGIWNFSSLEGEEVDECEILGTNGDMSFPIFVHRKISLNIDGENSEISFEPLIHVQQPLIDSVVKYFLGEGPNPSDGLNAVKVMELIDAFTGH